MTRRLGALLRVALSAAALSAGLALAARARVGLSTQFFDVAVEGLEPGGVYSLRELRGAPYAVKNRGDKSVEVALEVAPWVAPEAPYEPIPDLSWIELTPDRLRVEPGRLGLSDVVIRIPEDPALVGRHFSVAVVARTLKTGLIGAGVKSRLRFSLGPGPRTLDFALTPAELSLSRAKTGAVYDSAREGRRMTLANKTNVELRLRLEAVAWDQDRAPPPGGWETPSDPAWALLEPAAVTVGAFGAVEVRLLVVDAPASLKGKKAAFLVLTRLPDGTVVGRPHPVFVVFPPDRPAGRSRPPWMR